MSGDVDSGAHIDGSRCHGEGCDRTHMLVSDHWRAEPATYWACGLPARHRGPCEPRVGEAVLETCEGGGHYPMFGPRRAWWDQ